MGECPGPCWLTQRPRFLLHSRSPLMEKAASDTSLPSQKAAKTLWPSVAGVADARVFLGCVCALAPENSRDQTMVPSTTLTQCRKRLPPSAVALCTKRLFSQTMGEEAPG